MSKNSHSMERLILTQLNHCPIALTSCLCKNIERVINSRFIWFLESNGLITNFQCGFRSKRSTIDHLVCLETFVRAAFIKREHLTAVFFDLEKAYDTTWKYCIMCDLNDFCLKGRLPNFIDNFLSNRKTVLKPPFLFFNVRKKGFQRAAFYLSLYSIKINNIVKTLSPGNGNYSVLFPTSWTLPTNPNLIKRQRVRERNFCVLTSSFLVFFLCSYSLSL